MQTDISDLSPPTQSHRIDASGHNQVSISASLLERAVLRFTPAGVPAIDLVLSHEGTVEEVGVKRDVSVELRAVALGPLANQLSICELGLRACFVGFLAASRNRKGVVLHITQVKLDSFTDSELK